MGIDVALVDERGNVQRILHDSQGHVSSLALSDWPALPGSCYLRFVDPYGDTVFNQTQLPVLLTELQHCLSSMPGSRCREHIASVCTLVAEGQGQIHVYVKFIGD
jgi:hypothetical protein